MKIKTKVGSVAKNTLKYIRIQEKFIISSDLKFVSNILSSATIIGAGNRDAGCTVSHCLHTGEWRPGFFTCNNHPFVKNASPWQVHTSKYQRTLFRRSK